MDPLAPMAPMALKAHKATRDPPASSPDLKAIRARRDLRARAVVAPAWPSPCLGPSPDLKAIRARRDLRA